MKWNNLQAGLNYYVVVRHRNHVAVLSSAPIAASSAMVYDFSSNVNQAYGVSQQKLLSNGNAAMKAGDITKDHIIQNTDNDAWKLAPAILNQYHPNDLNLDGVVQATDYDLWFLNKAFNGHPASQP